MLAAVADRRLGRDGGGRFVGRHGLAGQRRLLGAQVLGLQKPEVGRDLVAGFEGHDVARHELFGRDQAVLPPRNVRASAESMLRIESRDFSARPSWMKPSSELRMTTARMIEASSHRPIISLTKPAASRT